MAIMTQKKIIIIGASSGIGYEMAKIYAQQNHIVAVTGRRQPLLDQLKEAFPQNILTACFDVMGETNNKKLESLIHELDGLDLVIYNAGYGEPSTTLLWEIENATIKTNVNGFAEIVMYAFNYFVKQGYGQIAVTSSLAALRGNSWAPAYSASKAFISNYAESLNIKAKKLNKKIVVTDIRPGFIDTKMAKGNGRFWVAPPEKASRQIVQAISKQKRVVYITRRWWIIAQLMKVMPRSIYARIG
jgi:short-subunit dehydrogenase